jgi:Ppx/GppA phosphatase family
MWQTGYPLHVMHGYVIPAREALEFSRLVHRVNPEMLSRIEMVNEARRPLLPYAALVLEHLVRIAKPKDVMISALGVREGLLYSQLSAAERSKDGLLAAARELNLLRSRSPRHGEELIAWTDSFMASSGIEETAEEKRLRRAACLLADIGWRAHPDYRGEQSLNIIANAAFVAVDHPGRTFLALSVFFRHMGLGDDELSPQVRELVSPRMRLSGVCLDAGRAAARAAGGAARQAAARTAREIRVARRRPAVQPAAPARAPDRARARDGRGLTAEALLDREAADTEHHQPDADDLHRRERPHQRLHVVAVTRVLGATQRAMRDDVPRVRAVLLEVGHHGGEAKQDAEHRKAEEAQQRQHHERKQAHRDDGDQHRNEDEIVVHQTHRAPPAGFVSLATVARRPTPRDHARRRHHVTRAFPRTGSCRTCRYRPFRSGCCRRPCR